MTEINDASGYGSSASANRKAVDDLFARITDINDQLRTADGETLRALTLERNRLRDKARDMAEARRHPESVAREIEELERRLTAIEGMPITKGYSEKHLKTTLQDPGAYAHDINRRIDAEHADEIEEITTRLARLRIIASEMADQDASEEAPDGGTGRFDP